MKAKAYRRYRLQRWWRGSPFKRGKGRWKTIGTSKSRKEILHAFRGWKGQIIDGTFRVKSPGGKTIAKRYGKLYRIVHGINNAGKR